MKLFASFSEAIREADGVIPQSFFGPEARGLLKVDRGKYCAIEAGLKVLGKRATRNYMDHVRDFFPYLDTASACCPRCDIAEDSLIALLWHLNDIHRLSFGQIADWLELEEEQLGYVTVVEPEVNVIVNQFAPTTAVRGE